MLLNSNKTKSFTYKNWQKIKKYKKSDVIVFYKKFINNYSSKYYDEYKDNFIDISNEIYKDTNI